MEELVYKKQKLTALKRLPASLSQEVGRVITRYAYLEHQLSIIIYKLMGVDPKAGRLAVREPSAKERVDIIDDLAFLRQLMALNQVNLDDIYKKVEKISERRNQIAHGLWAKDPKSGKIKLQITNSSRKLLKGSDYKVKRKIVPELLPFDVKECREFCKQIDALIKRVEFLEDEIGDLFQPSSETLPPRNLGMSRSRGRNPSRL